MMPVRRRICVVGGLSAGPSAAAKAARVDPSAEVILFEQDDAISYGICELPYYIGGEVQKDDLVVLTPEQMQREKNVTVRTRTRIQNISPSRKTIEVHDLSKGETREERYDRLIIATGSSVRPLGLAGEDARNVFHVKSLDDGLQIARFIEVEHPTRAVIIGGGYVGVEMAEALRRRRMEVTLLHKGMVPLDHVAPETSDAVARRLGDHGVTFLPQTQIVAFRVDSRAAVAEVLTPDRTLPVDLVILATGVRPNTQLAAAARVRLGANGGITTDSRLQTSVDNIFAAGDCCEVRNLVSNRMMYAPLATNAARMGWVAGENAAGGRSTFQGALRSIALRVFELEVVHLGLTAAEARVAGLAPEVVTIKSTSRVPMMPGGKALCVTLVADRSTRRLLGVDVSGEEGAVLRGNLLAPALHHRLTIDDVRRWDLAYAPSFSPLWDPILVAANAMARKLEQR
jgi:NADPH-dependent 2,4-dienoyl-CoA reductase/sulfur reductase-like enzyme